MKPHIFLKSEEPPITVYPRERAFKGHMRPGVFVGITDTTVPRPVLAKQPATSSPKPSRLRNKIWELGGSLHCSIIGTCLTTGELRCLLQKTDATIDRGATDHELHAIAVTASGTHNETAKQIQKALDRRHKLAINRFSAAHSTEDLRKYWDEAVQNGDIPGAYWALLTHPLATDALVRHGFGDVHLLSHLIGAANRADIHRLRELEQQKAALEEKLGRQQEQLRQGIVGRDVKIRELSATLSARIERERTGTASEGDALELAALDGLVSELRKQLDVEIRRRERAEKKAQDLAAARTSEDATRTAMEREVAALRDELEAAEAGLAALSGEQDGEDAAQDWNLAGLTVLYVGGRSHHIARLRAVVERASGQFLHHDGGIEERSELLPGLVSRADLAACPIDCVSHTAALVVKRLCRQAGKPFLPLRSSGVTSLLRAITSAEVKTSVSRAA